jgi:hypothetical protein
MALIDSRQEEVWSIRSGSLWLAAIGPKDRAPILYQRPDGDLVVVWGALFNGDATPLTCDSIFRYAFDPVELLPGSWAIVSWSGRHQSLSLQTDALASKPLYVAESAGGLLFASRVSAILPFFPKRPALDPAAAFDLLAFGVLTGQTTYYKGISHLPPGTVLRAKTPSFKPMLGHVAEPSLPEAEPGEDPVNAFIRLAEQGVARAIGSAGKAAVLLSGGMDSRLVWAITSKMDLNATAMSFGPACLPDIIVARQLCALVRAPHIHLDISPELIKALAPEVVRITDGTFSCLHAVGNILAAKEGPGSDLVMDGAQIWADVVPPWAWLLSGRRLVRRQLVYGLPEDLASLLTPQAGTAFLRQMEQRLDSFVDLAGDGSVNDRMLKLDRVALRMTVQASLEKLGWVSAASPLLDLTLSRFVASLPGRLRWNKWFQAKAICALAPDMGNLVYTETGYPLHTLRAPSILYLQKVRQRIKPTPLYDRGRRLMNVYSRWIGNELQGWFREVFDHRSILTDSLIKPGEPETILAKHAAHGGQAEILIRLATLFLWGAWQDRWIEEISADIANSPALPISAIDLQPFDIKRTGP